MMQNHLYIPALRTFGSTALALSAFALSAPVPAQEARFDSLIENGRNMPVLNEQNFDPNTVYSIPTPGPDATQFKFELKGYVFGLRMVKANYTGFFDDTRYAAYTDLKTSGLGALLKKLEIWAVTSGTYKIAGLRPDFHVQQNMDKKNRRVEMNYDNQAASVDVQIVPPLGSQGVPPASPEERYTANDTISAILTMMMMGQKVEGQLCNGSVPVFDSKQHYNLRMERIGPDREKLMGDKVDTIKCHVYYEPVSGFDPEDLPDDEEGGTPVKVHFTQVEGLDLWVPVRFTYKISSIKAVIKIDDMTIIPAGSDTPISITVAQQ